MNTNSLPRHARVVIVGGGIIGCSTAYHLAKLGWRDIVLLERKTLACGTTWHAAGLVVTFRDTASHTELAKYSLKLYRDLESETGQATGFINCGSIQLAMTADKVEEMRRGCSMARAFGIDHHEITPREVKELFPLAYVDDLAAGFYFPDDGRVNPADVTQALAKGARMHGAQIFENTKVTGITVKNGEAKGVHTEYGDIQADIVVLCPGMWGREVGLMAGVNLPLQAAEHYYLVSEPVPGMHNRLPILRDPGRCAYVREEAGKIMLGFFEPQGAPWAVNGIPEHFCFDEIQPNWERMEPHIARGMQRVPILFETGIRKFFCGPESFTPDHSYLIGRAPHVKRLFVACGFNSLGILSAGGAGHLLSRWIADGIQPMDIWDVDVRRILPCHNNKSVIVDRTVESLGITYQMHWPHRQWETTRNIKQSVLHETLAQAGACFGESAGWERPNWYARSGQRAEYEYDFERQNWFGNHAEEHRAVREAVGLFDQSSFGKLLVQGRDAVRALNFLSAKNVDVPLNKVVLTSFLNQRGGVEADVSIMRLREDRFLVVTPAFTLTQVEAWIEEHIPADAICTLSDISSAYAVLNLQGPASRALLTRVSNEDFTNSAFPLNTCRTIEIGYQSALAVRASYSGELGWELFVAPEMTHGVYARLIAAGSEFGLRHCGYHALNSLRLEKAYRHWSHDMGPTDSLLECGLEAGTAWHKPGGFIGQEALIQQRESGAPVRRLVQLVLSDPNPVLVHNEPIFRNGTLVGMTTSAAYGHTLGASVALGYIRNASGVTADFLANGVFEVEQANRRYAARASLTAAYDPQGLRARGL